MTAAAYSDGLLDLSAGKLSRYNEIAERRYATYVRAMGGRRSFRLLEIGCGTAGLAARFAQLGVDYWGIDIDDRMVDDCARRGVTFVKKGDFLTFEAGRFDVICASQVLEHIVVPRTFVTHIRELLNPGGIVHVDVPNHGALAGYVATTLRRPNRFLGIEYPHHSFAYRKRTLRRLFEGSFHIDVFDANPTHRTWGQANDQDSAFTAFYALSGALHLGSLLVAFGRLTP